MPRRILELAIARLAVSALWIVSAQAIAQDSRLAESLAHFPRAELAIATPDARLHRFEVWIADHPARRAQGLMYVRELPEHAGMLFLYPEPQRISMWMKNTYVTLDMLFIRADGRVESIAQETTPLSLESIRSQGDVVAVLELPGGTSRRLGIGPGAQVLHQFFEGRGPGS